ncbi:MAG: CBS domain-containing protein [Fidelibacterota bacterium]
MRPKSVRDIMTRRLVTFSPETNVLAAIDTLIKHKISGAPVLDKQGKLVGMLSEIDTMETLIHSSYHGEGGGCVRDFMSTNVVTVDPEMGIIDLAGFFQKKRYRRLPVMEHGELIGQVSRRDVLKAIQHLTS